MGLYDREYMRGPERGTGKGRLLTVAIGIGAFVVTCLVLNRNILRNAAHVYDGPRPTLLEAKPIELGEFEVGSGEVAVCDPGYDRQMVLEGAIATKVRNVAKGEWRARMIRHKIQYGVEAAQDVRCGELLAFVASEPLPESPPWKQFHPDIGVDSGQAGFFDWTLFRTRAAVPDDHPWKVPMLAPNDPWYSLCGDITLFEPHAGILPGGVVASSGWGDGGYPLYALRDGNGMIIGLRLVFISSDEYEPAAEKQPAPVPGEAGGP